MNKAVLQKIILSVFITLFLPSSCMMDTLKNLSYKFVENIGVYPVGVKIIDSIATILPLFAVSLIHSNLNKEHIPIACEWFQAKTQQRLTQIESELLKRETLLINAIYDDYNITIEQRKIINLIIEQSKEYERKYRSEPHPEAIHEITIPPHFTTLCTTNGINPDSINMVVNPIQGEHDAATTNLLIERTLTNNIIDIKSVIAPPKIEFFPSFFTLSQNLQDGTWAHEGRHLVCQHETIRISLLWAVAHITATPYEKMQNNQNYLLLRLEHERQAEILYNNPQLASMTRSYRSGGSYPNALFLSHYAQLAKIDELYKFTDRLRAYKPNPLEDLIY